ncbi:MAG: DUF2029 domain-containing protein [Thaumarchaeota archaeon]|nr:DUF2029 domain-containing protein [Nitrososphaerota archaeon]
MGISPHERMKVLYATWMSRLTLTPRVKLLVLAVVVLAFVLQALRVFLKAYPVMSVGVIPGNNFSLDFGSYYASGWRLLHNASQLYAPGDVSGYYPLGLRPTDFKYLPFFSFFILPLLALDYVPALIAWNVFQLLLMPVMGLLLYKALKRFNVVVIVGVLWVVLLQPLPIGPHYTISFYDLYTSQSYYWQWAEGQAKVFMTFLIIASYYLSKSRRPYLAGLAYGLGFFDPRFPLYAIPLVLLVNRGQYRRFSSATLLTLIAGDAILLYDGLGASFMTMVETSGVGTLFYQYTWIPFYAIAALTAVEGFAFIHQTWRQRSKSASSSGPLHKLQDGVRLWGRREFLLRSFQVQPALRLPTRAGLRMVHRLRTGGHQAPGQRWGPEGPMGQRRHNLADRHRLHGCEGGRQAEARQAISGAPLLDKHPHQLRRETFSVLV